MLKDLLQSDPSNQQVKEEAIKKFLIQILSRRDAGINQNAYVDNLEDEDKDLKLSEVVTLNNRNSVYKPTISRVEDTYPYTKLNGVYTCPLWIKCLLDRKYNLKNVVMIIKILNKLKG